MLYVMCVKCIIIYKLEKRVISAWECLINEGFAITTKIIICVTRALVNSLMHWEFLSTDS